MVKTSPQSPHTVLSQSSRSVLALTFLLIAGAFFLLDCQSVPIGDDLGYMFTDTAHHLGDGRRATSVSDITATISSHYMTTNGRFIVHWISMFFLNIAGHFWFCLANSIVFLLTVLFFYRLFKLETPTTGSGIILASVILFSCVPIPGVTWLSLVCYSVNYLWTAMVSLWIISVFETECSNVRGDFERGMSKKIQLLLGSIIAGSLQESFSLPLSAGLFLYWLINRKSLYRRDKLTIIAYWIGTIICCVAPGNLNHASQGGGFGFQAILHKFLALVIDIPKTAPVILIWFLVMTIGLIVWRKSTLKFIRNNIILNVSIIAAILLASLTFTSFRQLTFPSIMSGIIIVRYLRVILSKKNIRGLYNRIASDCGLLIFLVVFAGSWSFREVTSLKIHSLHEQAAEGKHITVYNNSDNSENSPLKRITLNFDFRRLPLIFDGYTKRGLSRLYSPDGNPHQISSILPATPEQIRDVASGSRIGEGYIETVALTKGYRCFAIPEGQKVSYLRDSNHRPISFERFGIEDDIYVIIPDNPSTKVVTYNRAYKP